ncbi:hypothetical protein MtrunA17_Chr1g0191341 [Medicago truncatula]|uniref:Uncharacterized protein n=1 Tax=Medicago truncatula TaxID=3880 RepID=A0A396JWL3_MEDTR|nr:hypothetical protein MtrunA17_Chr1g0191341 [Medicago truncatula]
MGNSVGNEQNRLREDQNSCFFSLMDRKSSLRPEIILSSFCRSSMITCLHLVRHMNVLILILMIQ